MSYHGEPRRICELPNTSDRAAVVPILSIALVKSLTDPVMAASSERIYLNLNK